MLTSLFCIPEHAHTSLILVYLGAVVYASLFKSLSVSVGVVAQGGFIIQWMSLVQVAFTKSTPKVAGRRDKPFVSAFILPGLYLKVNW
jgi:hypothetical protein